MIRYDTYNKQVLGWKQQKSIGRIHGRGQMIVSAIYNEISVSMHEPAGSDMIMRRKVAYSSAVMLLASYNTVKCAGREVPINPVPKDGTINVQNEGNLNPFTHLYATADTSQNI